MSRFYLTTAIDYVNNRPHLGTAYEKIAADVIARYRRLCGADVRFVMGNDEHSQNVFRKARESGLEPLAYCDQMEREFRSVWTRLNVSFDDFIRTTEPRHRRAVEALVQRMYGAGDIYEGLYEGWYCVSCEEFKPEKVLENGLCPIHRTRPDWIKERNFFFRLSSYRDRLLDHYRDHPEFVEPESRRNEMLRLLEGGLEDLSVSRAGQAWGIPLPFDPSSVVYVWYDALVNYIAAVGYGTDQSLFEKWWPAGLHLVGKDITRFHCVVWPAMLMSAGIALPRQVFGHGWVLTKGEKMSKSLGTVLDPLEAADRFGPDPLRLYLVKEIVFGSDGDFTWDRFEEKYNVDLANNLGNLVNRVAAMAERYRRGRLHGPGQAPEKLADSCNSLARIYSQDMDRLALEGGAAAAFRVVDAANEFIAEREPWVIARDDSRAADLDAVLWNASEALRIATVLLSPIMPASATEIFSRLGLEETAAGVRLPTDSTWRSTGERHVARRDPLWPRLEEAAPNAAHLKKETTVTDQPTEPASKPTVSPSGAMPTSAGPAPAGGPPSSQADGSAEASASLWPADGRISMDDFMKVDLRVAKVTAAERVANSKKLIKLEVDLGTETRTLVAGIAEAYEADTLVGRHVAIVANLKPAKLMGIESNGMVLAASPDGGKPILVTFDKEIAPGARVR
jgi:methionyl-tRNA synthetase